MYKWGFFRLQSWTEGNLRHDYSFKKDLKCEVFNMLRHKVFWVIHGSLNLVKNSKINRKILSMVNSPSAHSLFYICSWILALIQNIVHLMLNLVTVLGC